MVAKISEYSFCTEGPTYIFPQLQFLYRGLKHDHFKQWFWNGVSWNPLGRGGTVRWWIQTWLTGISSSRCWINIMPDLCGTKYTENNGQDFHSFKTSWTGRDGSFQRGEEFRDAASAARYGLVSMHGNVPSSDLSSTPAMMAKNETINVLHHTIFCLLFFSALSWIPFPSTFIHLSHHITKIKNLGQPSCWIYITFPNRLWQQRSAHHQSTKEIQMKQWDPFFYPSDWQTF